jgi:2'-5' RNA ligase
VRLFIAISIPQDVRAPIASLLQKFRAITPQVKWIRGENLHITLKFLGETDSSNLSFIEQSLAEIKSPQHVSLNFLAPAFMIRAKAPSIIWIGISHSENLQSLVNDIESKMHNFGFPKEDRPFVPHLTLARVPRSGPPWRVAPFPETLIETIRESSTEISGFSASEFHLIESKLKSSGAEYTTLHSFSFVAEG